MRDSLSRLLSPGAGMILCAIGLIATLALAFGGDLTLYIHPRYVTFTVILTVLGTALFVLALWFSLARPSSEHGQPRPCA